MFYTKCHTIGERRAFRLSQMIRRSFQHTAFFLWPVNSSSFKDVQPKPPSNNHSVSKSFERPHSPLFALKTPQISKFSWSWVKHKINEVLTLTNLKQAYFMLAVLHVWIFTHESFMSSPFLGLRRPFLCSRVFSSIFFSIFGSTKVCSDQAQLGIKKPLHFKGTGRHFEFV